MERIFKKNFAAPLYALKEIKVKKMQKIGGIISEAKSSYEVSVESNDAILKLGISSVALTLGADKAEKTYMVMLNTLTLKKK